MVFNCRVDEIEMFYRSIIVGLFDMRPERVTVVKGRRYVSFSFRSRRDDVRLSRHELIYSHTASPASRSPCMQDISARNDSGDGTSGISEKYENDSAITLRSSS